MAAATAKYYFRFRICWCHCLQSVKVYQQTKFHRYISIGGWDITTSVLEKQTSAISESPSGFDLDQFAVICMLFCVRQENFVQIGAPTAEIWRHVDFEDGGCRCQPCCICFTVMADHPRSAFRGLNSVPNLLVRRINSSADIAIYRFWRFCLKLSIHAPFGEFLGHIFPIWRHS